MFYMERSVAFKVTLGIYRQARHTRGSAYHLFSTEICHEDTFNIDCDVLPLNSSEIPYQLLKSAQRKAEQIAEALLEEKSEWWKTLPELFSGEVWDEQPVWDGGGDTLECYRYWYNGFRSVHFMKLEWSDWRSHRFGGSPAARFLKYLQGTGRGG